MWRYVDFPPTECAEQFGEAVGSQGFGCDALGCYGYVPFDDEDIDLSIYPGVKNATLEMVTLGPGDTLFIPSFWFHHIWHSPTLTQADENEEDVLRFGRRTIALTFTHQRRWENMSSMMPLAADIMAHWQRQQQTAAPEASKTGERGKERHMPQRAASTDSFSEDEL